MGLKSNQNAYVPRNKIIKILESDYSLAFRGIDCGFELIEEGKWVKSSWGNYCLIFESKPVVTYYSFDVNDAHKDAEKINGSLKWANNHKGHKFGVRRQRQHKNNRPAGGGFSFKPEIPYKTSGTGEYIKDGSEWEELNEELFKPKYSRKNHESQTIPKLEWPVARRKYRHGPRRFCTNSLYRDGDTERRVEEVRKRTIEHHKKAFGRGDYLD